MPITIMEMCNRKEMRGFADPGGIVMNSENKDVVVDPIMIKPDLLFISDLLTDPEHWTNKNFAEYYRLNSIKVH